MKKRLYLRTIIAALFLILFAFCGSSQVFAASVSDTAAPHFSVKSKTLYTDGVPYFSVVMDTLEKAKISYQSSNERVATVDVDGVITPIKKGKAVIYATVKQGGQTYTCELNIKVRKPYSKLVESVSYMCTDSTATFRLGRFGHQEPVTWTLLGEENASIIDCSADSCTIQATNEGEFTLIAECMEQTFTCPVKIYAASGEFFAIGPDSKPFDDRYSKLSSKKTKQYYMLRSYLDHISDAGGGTLVLTEGTYSIPETLYLSSYTTLILEDGAAIIKEGGSSSLFETISYDRAETIGAAMNYYSGSDITIKGYGNAVIDMNFVSSTALTAANTYNLSVSGISFKNMNQASFILLVSTSNTSIKGNVFENCKASKTGYTEAVRLDTADEENGTVNIAWTTYDCNANKGLIISENIFSKLECGIGSQEYSKDYPHTNIEILKNTFMDMSDYSIRIMNWDSLTIQDNLFTYINSSDGKGKTAIIMNGSTGYLIYRNRFENMMLPLSCYAWADPEKYTEKTEEEDEDDEELVSPSESIAAIWAADVINSAKEPEDTASAGKKEASGDGKSQEADAAPNRIYDPVENEFSFTGLLMFGENYIKNVTRPYIEFYRVFDDFGEENLVQCNIYEDYRLK